MSETRWMIVYLLFMGLGVIILSAGLFGPTIFNTDNDSAEKLSDSTRLAAASTTSPGSILDVRYPEDIPKLIQLNLALDSSYRQIYKQRYEHVRIKDTHMSDNMNTPMLIWLITNLASESLPSIKIDYNNGIVNEYPLNRTKYPISDSGSVNVRNAIFEYIYVERLSMGAFEMDTRENIYRSSALREKETIEGYNDPDSKYYTSEFKVDNNWTAVIHAIMLTGLLQFRPVAKRIKLDTSGVTTPAYKQVLNFFGVPCS